MSAQEAPLIDTITIVSFLFMLVLLIAAYTISLSALPTSSTATIRFIFIWHLFDALTHMILEASFLYHSFYSHTPDRKHFGAQYSTAPLALIWQEYAKADSRWSVADPVVVAIELPTVLLEGPGAAYICYLLANEKASVWFWILVVAVGEIYGGWMTFAPEWLTGSASLDTSNAMYMWVYLFFFNMLWVWIPGWLCWVSYSEIVKGLGMAKKEEDVKKKL
ncbi:hypothetical protein AA313_de0202568 [Arthrobotrys entomopaga]|nr:hypothetical protein AA313_de0202568 [Arthrobotrys entomopaga]